MPCAPLLRFTDCPGDTRAEAGEVMSGVLDVVGGGSVLGSTVRPPTKVFVRVYRTSSEHFAVLYPARAIATACRPLASINLKSCSVKGLPDPPHHFRVSPLSCEGTALTFRGAEVADWVVAFSESPQRRKRVSDHRLPLPVLIESEEDESNE